MKIMVLTPYLPHLAVGHGGGTAVRDLVTWLAKKHTVLVAALVRHGEMERLGEVEELGASVAPLVFPDREVRGLERLHLYQGRTLAWARSLRSGYPWFVEKYWSVELSRSVINLAQEFKPDAIQTEYLQLALLVRDLRKWRDDHQSPLPRLILNSHELGSVPRDRKADRSANPATAFTARREAAAWRRLQVDASHWADQTLCVTGDDHALYEEMGGVNLATVPLGMDLERISPDWNPGPDHRFLFVGSFNHRPNRLAADFLLKKVWPELEASLPGCRLVLAGRGSRSYLDRNGGTDSWRDRGVEALGFVEDLTPLFRESQLFLAPLPEGGGIKIKILEAMARGIPVVTTPVGAEGITRTEDEAAIIAPCDHRFTAAVLVAAADMEKSRARARIARELIEEKFGWDAITKRLATIYADG